MTKSQDLELQLRRIRNEMWEPKLEFIAQVLHEGGIKTYLGEREGTPLFKEEELEFCPGHYEITLRSDEYEILGKPVDLADILRMLREVNMLELSENRLAIIANGEESLQYCVAIELAIDKPISKQEPEVLQKLIDILK